MTDVVTDVMTEQIKKRGSQAAIVAIVSLITAVAAGWWTPPEAIQIPAIEWIGIVVTKIIQVTKPAGRMFSYVIEFPMEGVRLILTQAPWAIIIGVVTAIGWHLAGPRLAIPAVLMLGFVLVSGYWQKGMNTLALVAVSVPLALAVGGGIGIIASEFKKTKTVITTVLDVMQTIPTFAYLTPLLALYGFGPVVGLIASAIYAAPPMARNVILGLERVDPQVREAAIMSGATRVQKLFFVEIPEATKQIMIGVNQCLMAALSMVIIAAVIGGFDDIGWEVLLTMRKAQFGQALLAGLVIVAFAILIDRMSAELALERKKYNKNVSLAIVGVSVVVAVSVHTLGLNILDQPMLDGIADNVDQALGNFTAKYGETLDTIKNNLLFFVLLPLRVGFDDAVLPFTWGFTWTTTMSVALLTVVGVVAIILATQKKMLAGLMLIIATAILIIGIANLPWMFVIVGAMALGYAAGGKKIAVFAGVMLAAILISGLWDRALLSLYLCSAAVATCAVVGSTIGLICSVSNVAWKITRPICDMLQTIPLFVFLIPVLMFFQIGEFAAFLAIIAYAIVPMIRYTRHGLVTTPETLIEAATACGATNRQIITEVRIPYAIPTILLGLNQTILYAFAMLVIAALIGTTGLGQSIYLALGQADVGLGVASGSAMAILALVADRIVQNFATKQRIALGLE